jgi:GH25 family lysozyme M1 (1,4-beta-N-acetylmuramidase)
LYHYAGSSIDNKIKDADTEADYYLSQTGTLAQNEFPILDFEVAYGMTPSQQAAWIKEWAAHVEQKTGKTPWIYVPDYILNKMSSADEKGLNNLPLWYADPNAGTDPKHPPSTGDWTNLVAWQYSDKANIPGIGKSDDSYLYGKVPAKPV